MDIVVLIVSLLLTACILGAGFWWYKKNKPKHTFVGVDFGADTIQPKNIKNLFGPFRVKRRDGTKVQFPVPQGYASHRQDGKGTLFFGDLNTGQLFKPRRIGSDVVMDFVHGIFVELALADGRIKQIAAAQQGDTGLTLKHIMMGIGIIIALLIVVVYQYAKSAGQLGG